MKGKKKAGAGSRPAGWTEGAEELRIKVRGPMIRVISEAVYSQAIGSRQATQLRMTLFVPNSPGAHPAVLFFPGGGWLQAAKDRFIECRLALARAGFVAASAEYRTLPQAFPSQVQDGRAAVRFLRAHASDFSVDPARIGVMGNSAGGWLALMVAFSGSRKGWDSDEWKDFSSAVQACCALHPVTQLSSLSEGLSPEGRAAHSGPASAESLLLHGISFSGAGRALDPKEEAAAGASPEALLRRRRRGCTLPPVLLMHGTVDRLVSPLQSAALYERLRALGSPARYLLLEGVDHSSDPSWYQEEVSREIVRFFRQALGAARKA